MHLLEGHASKFAGAIQVCPQLGDAIMNEATKKQLVRGILPYAATILSLSLAVTLRIEHSCSDPTHPVRDSLPSALYPYSELISTIGSEFSIRD
ncbi:MAG: hypothetical protein DMD72_06015 [Gemmatimonadetes bacterium]|nr:MAG: hypothetical protein DMD72_06015 [Gemmatimonadota bacterium]PYO76371.1 MAG: hypothetical protein DMD63_14565 [Gemmatimonadota bacterium]